MDGTTVTGERGQRGLLANSLCCCLQALGAAGTAETPQAPGNFVMLLLDEYGNVRGLRRLRWLPATS